LCYNFNTSNPSLPTTIFKIRRWLPNGGKLSNGRENCGKFCVFYATCLEIAYIAEVRPCLAGKAKGFVGDK